MSIYRLNLYCQEAKICQCIGMIYPLHGQYPRGFYNGEKKITIFSWESLYTDRVDGLANATTYLAHELAKKHEVNFFTRGDHDFSFLGVDYHAVRPNGGNIIEYCHNMSHWMVNRFW